MSSEYSQSSSLQSLPNSREPCIDGACGPTPVHPPRSATSTLQQNSVTFPGDESLEITQNAPAFVAGKSNRTLSDLLKLHAEKGTQFTCSPEEANRLADVLGEWINSSSSPYETEDDFFTHGHAQDDASLPSSRRWSANVKADTNGRPRGQSESVIRNGS